MARVNVEPIALSDSRFDLLAQLAGLADRDHALGKMVRVWNECQERESYVLPGQMLDAIFGKHLIGDVLTQSGLAKRTRGRLFYICGTRGRIEWLIKRREEGRKGGSLGGRPSKPLGVTKPKPLGVDGNATDGNPSLSCSLSESEIVSEASTPPSLVVRRDGATAAVTTPPPVLTYPCDGESPRWDLTEAQIGEWAGLYHGIDIADECKRALAWVLADPARRKTAKGMKRFLVGWLGRAKNTRRDGGARGQKLTLNERNKLATATWGEE